MCRIAAYSGPDIALEDVVIRPVHSLLTQSRHATEAKLAVNGDGFGIAWYGHGAEPGLYRDVLPAWADGNLASLCRMVRSHRFIAHVRASTIGETSRSNCHPFSWKNWSFCHNGQVPHFPRIRRALEAALPDALYHHRRGTTDSEMLFLTALANGLEHDPAGALQKTLRLIGPTGPEGPVRLTCVFSDGAALYGFRLASDRHAPTLYHSNGSAENGVTLASEPLCRTATHWTPLETGHLYRVGPDGSIERSVLLGTETLAFA